MVWGVFIFVVFIIYSSAFSSAEPELFPELLGDDDTIIIPEGAPLLSSSSSSDSFLDSFDDSDSDYDEDAFVSFKQVRYPLHCKIMDFDVGQVSVMLLMGHDCNRQDELGKTPLHYACITGCRQIAAELLSYGAQSCVRDNRDAPPLFYAVQNNYWDVVKEFPVEALNSHALFPKEHAFENYTLLEYLVFYNCLERAEFLLNRGANLSLRAVKIAIKKKYDSMVSMFCEHALARRDFSFLVRVLHDYHSNFSIVDCDSSVLLSISERQRISLLNLAVLQKNVHLIKRLLRFGVRTDTIDSHNFIPLFYAIESDDIVLIKLLAATTPRSFLGAALHWAVKCNALGAVAWLLTLGADIDAIEDYCLTPLRRAELLKSDGEDNDSIIALLRAANEQKRRGAYPAARTISRW
ncbi:ankyrin repeat domain-containing protein [Candidatus Babeliales bacterium]|nr:ankyrin repeat domain-containing protein [Candidatus Babeliales bacterium]